MTTAPVAPRPVDFPMWLDVLSSAPDVMPTMIELTANNLMSAEVDAICGAPYRARSVKRVNRRNGYRKRPWKTRAGTLSLLIPKLRRETYFPAWLLQRHRRAEDALTTVVGQMYLHGVSTRRIERLARQMGITQLSRSTVSKMASALDAEVKAFRERPLGDGPYTFVWLDAIVIKSRQDGRVATTHALVATGVNRHGNREVLGMEISSAENGAGWMSFLRSLVERGLSGVDLVTSDAHPGLVGAIGQTLPGVTWQRCKVHYLQNLLKQVPRSANEKVTEHFESIFHQRDPIAVNACFNYAVKKLAEYGYDEAADHLDDARDDLLGFTAFPRSVWRIIRSNNPIERLNKDLRKRTDVVGVFPNPSSVVRLVGAVLVDQHQVWADARRRYISLETLSQCRIRTDDKHEDMGTVMEFVAA